MATRDETGRTRKTLEKLASGEIFTHNPETLFREAFAHGVLAKGQVASVLGVQEHHVGKKIAGMPSEQVQKLCRTLLNPPAPRA